MEDIVLTLLAEGRIGLRIRVGLDKVLNRVPYLAELTRIPVLQTILRGWNESRTGYNFPTRNLLVVREHLGTAHPPAPVDTIRGHPMQTILNWAHDESLLDPAGRAKARKCLGAAVSRLQIRLARCSSAFLSPAAASGTRGLQTTRASCRQKQAIGSSCALSGAWTVPAWFPPVFADICLRGSPSTQNS